MHGGRTSTSQSKCMLFVELIYRAHFVEALFVAPVARFGARLRFGVLALGRAGAPFAPRALAQRIIRVRRIHFRRIALVLCNRNERFVVGVSGLGPKAEAFNWRTCSSDSGKVMQTDLSSSEGL